MLPPRAAKEQDPAQLVLNAANYIQQLVATVQARVHKGTLPVDRGFLKYHEKSAIDLVYK
ncbi:hypothetical protein ANCCEY_12408 [Ancylostoma ceylanicum]|uniref:BHLH domain-containing protein n=1 Tax=Ancylostoma ceylanicum TaxID=53326 RepID=A0A0D6L9C1_9BILA|nr:hypothetical protein ANCCEY_12408 [Ancylostoma ceylanicum]